MNIRCKPPKRFFVKTCLVCLALSSILRAPTLASGNQKEKQEADVKITQRELLDDAVLVEIVEGASDKIVSSSEWPEPVDHYHAPAFALVDVPKKYSNKGLIADRTNPFHLRASGKITLRAGEYRILLRAKGTARLTLDGRKLAQTKPLKPNYSAHEDVPELAPSDDLDLHPLPIAHQEQRTTVQLDGGEYVFMLQAVIGGKGLRAEPGELSVAIAGEGESFRLLAPQVHVPLTDEAWHAYCQQRHEWRFQENTDRRRRAAVAEDQYWHTRHETARGVISHTASPELLHVSPAAQVQSPVDRFIASRLEKADVPPAPLADDGTFLRRVTLDTAGVIPTREEIAAFQDDPSPIRRKNVIDRLLDDPRWADHWVGYWQDVLAENPGILKPKLNNTGPFRWWIYESFLDNKAMDRFATELIMMEGSRYGGGPGGFAMATQNDAPMAAKAHVIAKAFLAAELKCARCHDAPFHDFTQKDTFSLAAMLGRQSQSIPETSVVPTGPGAQPAAVTVSLKAGEEIAPTWPLTNLAPADVAAGILRDAQDSREQLAAIITSTANDRFAQVIVNRLWQRYLGRGLVEPVDDWQDTEPSHPQLLEFLARELVTHDYDLKHVARLILTSHCYQREVLSQPTDEQTELLAAPARRRLSAEQVIDSLFLVAGKPLDAEPLTLDPEGRKGIENYLNLGVPRRAWEFTSLSNERDRPGLSLPVAQSIIDVLTAFMWRQSRQDQ